MRRILVLGCSGAGKSTLAYRLGALLGLPVVHLDVEYWRPGWTPSPQDDFAERVAECAARPCWVIDGNYARTLDLRLRDADLAIHLDFARWRCLWGVTRRVLLANLFSRPRPDMAAGCAEQWDWEFIEWVWNFHRDQRLATLAHLERHAPHVRVVTLRTRGEIAAFVDSLACDPRPTDAAPVPLHSPAP